MEHLMATPITSVPGIGKATAFALSRHGFRSAEDLVAADEEVLAAVPGFGVSRAARVIESAQKLVGAPVASSNSSPVAEAEAAPSAETAQPPAKEDKDKRKKKSKAAKKEKEKKKDKEKGKKKKKGKGKKKAGKK